MYQAGCDAALEKLGGSRLRSAMKIVRRGDKYVMEMQGRPIGAVTMSEVAIHANPDVIGKRLIRTTDIFDKKLRGMGLGRKLYGEVMRREPGALLRSDSSLSGAAQGVWERLAKTPGYTVRRNPAAAYKHSRRTPGKLFESVTHPLAEEPFMYTGSLPAKAKLPG